MHSSVLETAKAASDVHALASSGFPLLHQAVIEGDFEAVLFLLKRKASRFHVGPLGLTAVQLAQLLGRRECLRHLAPFPERRIQVGALNESTTDSLTPEEFERWTGIRYVPFLEADLKTLRFAIRCCKRGKKKGHFDAQRQWLAQWHARELLQGSTPSGVVKWIDATLGYGLFASQNLPPWTFVGTYTGKLVRRDFFLLHTNDYCFYYPSGVETIRPLLIDAEIMGNELRYANHSDGPNMEGIGVLSGPIAQVIFRTNRSVRKGEQLTYDYGADFWKCRDIPKKSL